MISICIPVYNFSIISLVRTLSHQINELQIAAEIILIDDASQEKFQKENKEGIEKIDFVKYIQLPENIGRSKIRNLFLQHVFFDYLLFLDCDSIVYNQNFIEEYIKVLNEKPKVVCGGRVYPKKPLGKNMHLSWKYGTKRESKAASKRILNPYKSFMTNNFIIAKGIFNQYQFNEQLVDYGHEDTILGLELKEAAIEIKHIDNPVLNGDIETNAIFIKKTEAAIENLLILLQQEKLKELIINHVKLASVHHKLRNNGFVIKFLFYLLKPILLYLFKKGIVSLHLFDFYKLGYMFKLEKKVKLK